MFSFSHDPGTRGLSKQAQASSLLVCSDIDDDYDDDINGDYNGDDDQNYGHNCDDNGDDKFVVKQVTMLP